jgi:hypothetical protein
MPNSVKTQLMLLASAILVAFFATVTAARWLYEKPAAQPRAMVALNADLPVFIEDASPLAQTKSQEPSPTTAPTDQPTKDVEVDHFKIYAGNHSETDDLVFANVPRFPEATSGRTNTLNGSAAANLEARSSSVLETAALADLLADTPNEKTKRTASYWTRQSEPASIAEDQDVVGRRANDLAGNQVQADQLASQVMAFQSQVSESKQEIDGLKSEIAELKTLILQQSRAGESQASQIETVDTASPTALATFSSPTNANAFRPTAKTPLATAAKTANKHENNLPHVLLGSENFELAGQPKLGDHYHDDRPLTDQRAHLTEPLKHDFSPDPDYQSLGYSSYEQQQVYEGKKLYANQRPLVELGRPWYQLGQLSEGYNWFGQHNTITPQFLIYGDHRTAFASNNNGGDSQTLIATELNLDIDLKLTGTERFHAFVAPLDNGVQNTRYLLDDDDYISEADFNFEFGYFEGDLGAMVGGFIGETLPFDAPFAIGVMPLLIQNGVWFEDAFLGVATTLAAKNSARLNISNMDITFFAGYDKINSPAFAGDDSAARIYGIATFIEAMNGYFEIDYAFLDDRTFDDRSYHNFGFAFSRRYGRLVSNSTRVIVNAGQSTDVVENTADGVLLLSENSLITASPSTLVPYFNFFAGFDRPQSAARAGVAEGVLRNTGILFESDGMTGYPTLDATANDTYGGAVGLNLIADDFSQQLMVEVAMLGVMGEDANRNAPGEQIGLGFRYQLPLSNSVIFRADGMYGFLNDSEDIGGIRMELRQKW